MLLSASNMDTVKKLLKLAQDCYAQARITLDPNNKRTLVQKGDQYLKEADEFQQGRAVVQAAFPKRDPKVD